VQVEEGISEVNGTLYVGPLKTKASRRVVTIPAFLADELGRHLRERARVDDLVFPSPSGGPLRRTNFGHRFWTPAVVGAHLDPAPTFHDLRHTAAALAIVEGAHPKAIQARMGHASITTTLNTYGHLFPSLDVELADRLDAVRAERLAVYLRRVDRADVVDIERAKR
jgi:integrase